MPHLSSRELADALALRDLSDPAQGTHAMQTLLDAVIDAAASASADRPHIRVVRDSPLVPVADNYDRLGFPTADVTRDRRYTRYVSYRVMLRSHTSAAIPGLLDRLATGAEPGLDDLVVLPGLVYRRDSIDRTHVGEPHQVDLWRLSSRARFGVGELLSLAGAIVEAVLPGARWRAVPATHPYTRDGRQIDVHVDGQWLELAECGLVADHLWTGAGLDPARWSGLALGMGLDRALMLSKGIPDIRVLRSVDPRVQRQLVDLDPWRPVSFMPPLRRDLSIVVDEHDDAETLGDRVRSALGADADDLESVELLALTPWAHLPESARNRLALRPDQANALVRLTLRPLDRTLTDPEANRIRDRVYRALHRGPVLELIAG